MQVKEYNTKTKKSLKFEIKNKRKSLIIDLKMELESKNQI